MCVKVFDLVGKFLGYLRFMSNIDEIGHIFHISTYLSEAGDSPAIAWHVQCQLSG